MERKASLPKMRGGSLTRWQAAKRLAAISNLSKVKAELSGRIGGHGRGSAPGSPRAGSPRPRSLNRLDAAGIPGALSAALAAALQRRKVVAVNVKADSRVPFLDWMRSRGWTKLVSSDEVARLQSLGATHGAEAIPLGLALSRTGGHARDSTTHTIAFDVVLASARLVGKKSAFGTLSKSLENVAAVVVICMNAPPADAVIVAFELLAEQRHATTSGHWPRSAPARLHASPCRFVAVYDAADVALAEECRARIAALELSGGALNVEHILVDRTAPPAALGSLDEPLVKILVAASKKTKQELMTMGGVAAPPMLAARSEIAFAQVLRFPKLRAVFRAQLASEFSPEGLEFWEAVQPFRAGCRGLSVPGFNPADNKAGGSGAGGGASEGGAPDLSKWYARAQEIVATFVREGGEKAVNIPSKMVMDVKARMDEHAALVASAAEGLEAAGAGAAPAEADAAGALDGERLATTFNDAETEVLKLMGRDAFSRFKRTALFEAVQRNYFDALASCTSEDEALLAGAASGVGAVPRTSGSASGSGSTSPSDAGQLNHCRSWSSTVLGGRADAGRAEWEVADDAAERGRRRPPAAKADSTTTAEGAGGGGGTSAAARPRSPPRPPILEKGDCGVEYLFLDGENAVQGPFPVATLAEWHAASMLLDHTFVAKYGDDTWITLAEMLAARAT